MVVNRRLWLLIGGCGCFGVCHGNNEFSCCDVDLGNRGNGDILGCSCFDAGHSRNRKLFCCYIYHGNRGNNGYILLFFRYIYNIERGNNCYILLFLLLIEGCGCDDLMVMGLMVLLGGHSCFHDGWLVVAILNRFFLLILPHFTLPFVSFGYLPFPILPFPILPLPILPLPILPLPILPLPQLLFIRR